MPLAEHERVIDVNVMGVVNGCHAAFPDLRRTPEACVVNMAPASEIYGQPDIATYSASKFAERGLTEALDLEWRDEGIRVVDIWAMWVRTALSASAAGSPTTERMGIKLEPKDVAERVWKAVNYRGRVPRPHWLVDRQTRLLNIGQHISPAPISRIFTGWLSRE